MILEKVKSTVEGLVGATENVITLDEDNIIFNKDMTLTPIGMNTILGQLAVTFKAAMVAQDKAFKYTVLSNPKEVPDPKKVAEIQAKYKDLNKQLEVKMSAFKDSHPEMFHHVPSAPNIAKYCSVALNESFSAAPVDIDVANFLFRTSAEEAKEYSLINSGSIKIATKRSLLPEFKDQVEDFKQLVIKELGVPSAEDIKEEIAKTVPMIKVQGQSLRRGSVATNVVGDMEKESLLDQSIHNYVKSLFVFLV